LGTAVERSESNSRYWIGGNWWAWEFLVYPNEGEPKAERELDPAWVKDGFLGSKA